MPFMVRWMVRSEREITREEHEALLALADREAARRWKAAGFTLEVMGGAGVIAVGVVAMPTELDHPDWLPLLASLTALRLAVPGTTVEISGDLSLIVWDEGRAQYQIATWARERSAREAEKSRERLERRGAPPPMVPDPPIIPAKLARQFLERSDTEPGVRIAEGTRPHIMVKARPPIAKKPVEVRVPGVKKPIEVRSIAKKPPLADKPLELPPPLVDPLIDPPPPVAQPAEPLLADKPFEEGTNRLYRRPSTIWSPLELVRAEPSAPAEPARAQPARAQPARAQPTPSRRSALFKRLGEAEVSGFQVRAAQFRLRAVGYLAEDGEVLLERVEEPTDPNAAFPAAPSPVLARVRCRVALEESFGLELGLELALIAPAVSSVPVDVAVVFRGADDKILGRELFSWDLSADASSCFGRLLFDIRCGKAERLEVVVRGGRFAKAAPSMERRVVSPCL